MMWDLVLEHSEFAHSYAGKRVWDAETAHDIAIDALIGTSKNFMDKKGRFKDLLRVVIRRRICDYMREKPRNTYSLSFDVMDHRESNFEQVDFDDAIEVMAKDHKLHDINKRIYSAWLPEEVDSLRNNYMRMNDKELAIVLSRTFGRNRTEESITHKRKRLGLKYHMPTILGQQT